MSMLVFRDNNWNWMEEVDAEGQPTGARFVDLGYEDPKSVWPAFHYDPQTKLSHELGYWVTSAGDKDVWSSALVAGTYTPDTEMQVAGVTLMQSIALDQGLTLETGDLVHQDAMKRLDVDFETVHNALKAGGIVAAERAAEALAEVHKPVPGGPSLDLGL